MTRGAHIILAAIISVVIALFVTISSVKVVPKGYIAVALHDDSTSEVFNEGLHWIGNGRVYYYKNAIQYQMIRFVSTTHLADGSRKEFVVNLAYRITDAKAASYYGSDTPAIENSLQKSYTLALGTLFSVMQIDTITPGTVAAINQAAALRGIETVSTDISILK